MSHTATGPTKPLSLSYLLRLWGGVSEPVGPRAYALSGFGLMLFKYAAEALLIWVYTSAVYMPWHFFSPLLSVRASVLQPAPLWLGWVLFAWSLPFLWVAISMSVRRAADAGSSPWLGLLVLVPIVNLVFMPLMCFPPPSEGANWSPHGDGDAEEERATSAAMALGTSLVVGALMLFISVYLLASYGASLFMGTPLLMGAVAAFQYNRVHSRSYGASIGLGLAAVSVGGLGLLLFALEGLICVAMAVPLMLPLGGLGGLMGKAIAESTRRPGSELLAALTLLPVWALAESYSTGTARHEVITSVEINAPPAVVWQHVIGFPDLPPPSEWYFRWGIACPERARIEGQGVGAIRYCEFSTGTFVEPITHWEPGRRLAFDVTDQPAPMVELSPYRHIHPPHLDGYLRSNRGEFRLIALPQGRTRLEGSTWYELDMFPQTYWTLWSDFLIHRIHERVLLHVKRLSEAE